jgi:hypothetical protein
MQCFITHKPWVRPMVTTRKFACLFGDKMKIFNSNSV